jgi:Rrf2 family iron-sulfur cluster assembly transcriptional regulator
MIKFSRREDYAVILVNKLAQEYDKRLVPLSEVAEEYAISLLFLRNLANDLRTAGIIKAVEGKTGGYFLTKEPKEIKMGDILGTFSKDQLSTCCPGNTNGEDKRICPKQDQCITGNVWRKMNQEFIEKVYEMTLEEFRKFKLGSSVRNTQKNQ